MAAVARAYRRYGKWWRMLELRRPWLAGMTIGASLALGEVTGVLLVIPAHDYSGRDVRDLYAAVGAATAFTVGSVIRGSVNQRKANAAKRDSG
jgi:hypothetical protein